MSTRIARSSLWYGLASLLLIGVALANGASAALPGASPQPPKAVTVPSDLNSEQVGEFVALLGDADSRQLLMDLMRADLEAPRAAPDSGFTGLLRGVYESSARLSQQRQAMLESLSNADTHFAVVLRNLTDDQGMPAVLKGVLILAVMIGGGFAAEWAACRRLHQVQQRFGQTLALSPRGKLAMLGLRLILDLMHIAVFAFVAWALSFLFFQRFEPTRVLALAVVAIVVVTRVAWAASRRVLAPGEPGLRLMSLSEDWALRLHRWTVAVVAVGATGFFTCALLKLLGLDPHLHRLMLIASDTAITAMLIVMVWKSRRAVAEWLTREPNSAQLAALPAAAERADLEATEQALTQRQVMVQIRPWRQSLAQIWHLLATGYLLVLWWLHTRDVALRAVEASNAAIVSIMVLLAIPVVDAMLAALLNDGRPEDAAAKPTLRTRYGRGARIIARLALVGWALMELATAAGFAFVGVVESPFGERIGASLLDVSAALIIALVIWELVKGAIERHLPEDEARPVAIGEEGAAGKATRAATLLPLLRSFVLVVLIIMVTLIVLSSLGVNIAPLLAGAGVVGLAIGFGSQKLVQDIVSGIFFLVDDAFRVGEYIEAGGMKGTVESISIRSMQLRHHLGPVQTLPYGEIQAVRNHSRDWVTIKLEIRLPYDVDIEKVRKIIKKIGEKMLENPEYGHHFLQPLKSQGVSRVEDSALIVRMKFTTVPNEQWVIRREAYRLVKDALAAQGIEFAHRRVFVGAPDDNKGHPPALSTTVGAAAAAIEAAEQGALRALPAADDRG